MGNGKINKAPQISDPKMPRELNKLSPVRSSAAGFDPSLKLPLPRSQADREKQENEKKSKSERNRKICLYRCGIRPVRHVPSSAPDGTDSRLFKIVCQAGGKGHPSQDPSALLSRGQDPHSAHRLRGDDSIAELCRKEGIAQSFSYTWSKEFMEAGKRRLAGAAARAAIMDEVKDLRREARDLKECVAFLTFESRLLPKKHGRAWGRR